MACTPYSPTPGIFFNTINWELGGKGPWSFQRVGDVMQLKNGANVVDSQAVPAGSTCNWMWFQNTRFVALRAATTSAGFLDYRLWIFDLRDPAAVTHYQNPEILSTLAGQSLNLHPAPDDSAYFIFLATGTINETKNHAVYRSAMPMRLAGAGPGTHTAQRLAEFINNEIWIYVSPGPPLPAPHTGGGTLLDRQALPLGECDVTTPSVPAVLDFGEVVLGGPPALATSTRNAVIRNSGNDCLDILTLTPAAGSAFTIGAIAPPLPRTLAPNATLTVPITFAPPALGAAGPTPITIGRNPARGDDTFSCRGTARAPVLAVTFAPSPLNFGTQPVGVASAPRNLEIRNTGEGPITVNVPASPAGAYQWAAVNNQAIPFGGSINVPITFTPAAEGAQPGAVTITSNAPGSPHTVNLTGNGCLANGVLVPPTSPIAGFGNLEQGFRTVRIVRIGNSGDGTLRCRLRIQGADAALYGIQPATTSITAPLATHEFDVNPVARCGAGPTGPGSVDIAIVFWANDTPRATTAQLVLEELSGATVVSTNTYALSATIVAAVPVDAGLVLDRSGSMAGDKITSAINAGRLFVRLMRPDVSDRVTIVRYNSAPDVVQPIAFVNSATAPTQATIENTINATSFTPTGSTCIAGGVMLARTQLDTARAAPVPPLVRRSMVVLTDGIDNTAYLNPADNRWYSIMGGASRDASFNAVDTEPLPGLGDIRVYAIGIGTDEQIDRGQLARLSQATGGDYLVARSVATPGSFELEKHFTQIFMGVVDLAVISDPVWDSAPGDQHTITFDILRGDFSTFLVIYDMPGFRLPFEITTPAGELIDMSVVPAGFATRVGETPSARFVEIKFPEGEPDRYAGQWTLRVLHPTGTSGVTSHMTKQNGPTRFGVAIGAGSNFRMQPYVTPAPVRVGDTILMSATVAEAGLRVKNCRVTVTATSPSGVTWHFTLLDDGAHQDGARDDGEYAEIFRHTAEGGSYSFAFRAEGLSHDREPVVREAVLSKYVEGRLPLEPVPTNPLVRCCAKLVRIATIAVIVMVLALIILFVLYRR